MSYTPYSQNDPAWKNKALGSDSPDPASPNHGTIGMYGCYVTAIANVCRWDGYDHTPAQIDDLCNQNGWFVGGDLIGPEDIPAKLCPNLKFVSKTKWTGPTPMSFFADASDPNVVYIVCLDASAAPGVQTHYSMVWATTGTDLIIDDSWDGVRKHLSHYGDPSKILQSAVKFVKVTPPAPAPAPAPVEAPAPAPAPVPEPTPAPVMTPPAPAPAPADPTPVVSPAPGTVVTPDPTPATPAPVTPVAPKPPTKVVVEPTYFKAWELFVALVKKLLLIA